MSKSLKYEKSSIITFSRQKTKQKTFLNYKHMDNQLEYRCVADGAPGLFLDSIFKFQQLKTNQEFL